MIRQRPIRTGDRGAQVWFFNDAGRRWEQEPHVLAGHTDWVRDVAWAPNLGLPFNTIASASQVPTLCPGAYAAMNAPHPQHTTHNPCARSGALALRGWHGPPQRRCRS